MIGQKGRASARPVEGTDALLATGYLQQFLVNGAAPPPIESHLEKGVVKRPPMNLFSLGQRAIDVEDQRAGALQHLSCVGNTDGRRSQWEFHPLLPAVAAAAANTRLASTSSASIDITSSLVKMRSRFETMRFAWRRRTRSRAFRIERALEKSGCVLRAAI